jgi:hypothetical protein
MHAHACTYIDDKERTLGYVETFSRRLRKKVYADINRASLALRNVEND